MDLSQDRINALLARPSESLAIELKSWIDPASPEGIAKIAKAAIGLRNRNGGYLIIGIDDKTLMPSLMDIPNDIQKSFHLDSMQGIISRYASIAFEIFVGFAERDNGCFPVIGIPDGVRVPVACKSDLKTANDKYLLREGAVYFRTLGSNGTPSTAAAKPNDWADIVEICFDNREADIARFIRRHLGGERAKDFFNSGQMQQQKNLEQKTIEFEEYINGLRLTVFKEENLNADMNSLGSWSVTLLLDPSHPDARSTQEFLNIIAGANPNYTGWPVWLDTRTSANTKNRPRKRGQAWEALISTPREGVDYQYMNAKGEFYLWRVLQDDLTHKVDPLTVLDPTLVLYRVAETIAVGLNFSKALKFDADSTLGFYFKWENLKGRALSVWADGWGFSERGPKTHDNVVTGFTNVPATTAPSSIAPYVKEATLDLFAAFEGFEYSLETIEQWVTKVLSRSR